MGKSIQEILNSAPTAAKFRDFVGEVLTITDYVTVSTKHGEAVQLLVERDGEQLAVWAPSVVATQVKELAAEGYLPLALKFEERESATGNRYYTLALPAAERPASLPMPEGER